ncbi:hypothetical protein BE08_36745 [Sorangium cellulosum]|uniref:Secreted protein n=1 Tax=Sorangium cellulosum TaxID=56 RepID=A0A150PLF4_SORCE|nr:hypothetical protein BE08_36745 [Sorangium cellulosum]
MYRDLSTLLRAAAPSLSLALAVSAASCAGDEPERGPAPAAQPAARHARVHFKGGSRLRNDLAQLLQLDPDEVCNEFGTKSCSESVHTVALGGLDPYRNQIFRSSPTTGLGTTFVVERMALQACRQRAERDIAGGEASPLVWRDVTTALGRAASVDALYASALGRPPTARERDGFESLYALALAEGPDVAEAETGWATLSCFAVVTSIEFLFY